MAARGSSTDRCSVPRCRAPREMGWHGKSLCDRCWQRWCAGKIDLHALLGVPRRVMPAIPSAVDPARHAQPAAPVRPATQSTMF